MSADYQAALRRFVTAWSRRNRCRLRLDWAPTWALVSGAQNGRSQEILLTVDPEGDEVLAAEQGCALAEAVPVLLSLVEFACRHERGHWTHCPQEQRWGYQVEEGVTRGLAEKLGPGQVSEPAVQELTHLFCDLVTDLCEAAEPGEGPGFLEGRALGCLRQWRALGPSDVTTRVRLCLLARVLFPGPSEEPFRTSLAAATEEWLGRQDAKTRAAIGRAAKVFRPTPFRKKRVRAARLGGLDPEARKGLEDRGSWNGKARQVARALADWFRPTGADSACATGASLGPVSGRVAPYDGEGPGPPPSLELAEAEFRWRDHLYQARGDRVGLGLAPELGRGRVEVPYAWLQARRLAQEESAPASDLWWSRTLLVPSGPTGQELWFYRKEQPLSLSLPGGPPLPQLPHLAFVVDASRSMDWEPERGAGPYDLVLRTLYGLWRSLEGSLLADRLHYAALTFSSRTCFSGWHPWHDLDPVKRTLLRWEGKHTYLDVRQLDRLAEEAPGPFAVFLITDAAFEERRNGQEVLRKLLEWHRAGRQVVFVQLGGEGRLFQRLREEGVSCHRLDRRQNLEGLVLGQVDRVFRAAAGLGAPTRELQAELLG